MEARGDGSGEGDFRSALVSAIAGQTVYRNFELIHRKAGLKKKKKKTAPVGPTQFMRYWV